MNIKLYRGYIILILLLAIVMNWVVEGVNDMDKVDMNLDLMPKMSIIIIELLQALLFLRLFLLHTNNPFIVSVTLLVAVFCIVELIVLKASGASITIWISGIRYYFSFLPLFLLSYLMAYKGFQIKKEFNWLLVLVMFQVPVVIYQYLNRSHITIIRKRQLLFDLFSGTMGGIASNLMSMVICIGLLYFLVRYMQERKVKLLIPALLLLVPSVLAESKGMFLLIFIILIYLAIIFKLSMSQIISLGFIGLIMVGGFIYFYELLGYNESLDADYLVTYTQSITGAGRLSRIDSVPYAFSVIFEKNALFLGLGIGNANKSPIGDDGQYFDFFTIRHSMDILITETGLLGVFFFIYVIVKLFQVSKFLIRNAELLQDEHDLLLARIFMGLILVFLFGVFWVDALFRVQFMYPFGMLAGYMVGVYKRIKETAVYKLDEGLEPQTQMAI
jgi:hypothetical protein